ncbi:hypothetical protein LO763_03475 [Glycomyces sp. A-F 0318]|uniref:hypothetical protein n=1 Tax=Glycomyces amatae TaxID=2881355 RepID=UPI001E433C22|nr:hypothetical protein [Glycomyces amatae]MCD0442684.1 hypothetical protein [Glycomyces amatae]
MSGWAAAAAVAVTAGIGAVALAQGGSFAGPEQPMSEDEVVSALADADDGATSTASASESPASPSADESPSAAATPTGPLEATPSAAADGHVLGGDGGTFQAVCEGDQVRLAWWVPAQGWSTGTVDPGPAALASIAFTGGGDDDDDDDGLVYEVACAGGVPTASLQSDDDDDDADD